MSKSKYTSRLHRLFSFLRPFLHRDRVLKGFFQRTHFIFRHMKGVRRQAKDTSSSIITMFLRPVSRHSSLFMITLPSIFPVRSANGRYFVDQGTVSFRGFRDLFTFSRVGTSTIRVRPSRFFVTIPSVTRMYLRRCFCIALVHRSFFMGNHRRHCVFLHRVNGRTQFVRLRPHRALFVRPVRSYSVNVYRLINGVVCYFQTFMFNRLRRDRSTSRSQFHRRASYFNFFMLSGELVTRRFGFNVIKRF